MMDGSPLRTQMNSMAQRMGAAPGGLGAGLGPPPQAGPQQAPGGAPTSRLAPLLQQVLQILVQGNPADLAEFGKFVGQLQQLQQDHMGQGEAPGMPTGGGMPPGAAPQQPMR